VFRESVDGGGSVIDDPRLEKLLLLDSRFRLWPKFNPFSDEMDNHSFDVKSCNLLVTQKAHALLSPVFAYLAK
jgi:hypothetical protein